MHKWPLTIAFLLSVCAAQTATNKPPEPETIGAFYYLDSSTQMLKKLPSEDWKRHRGGGFSVTDDVKLSGNSSPFHIATGDKTTFVFKVFADEEAGRAKLFRLTVKGNDREYELGKWKRRDFTPNHGLSVNVARFGASSYALSPELPLEPGEYALTTGTTVFTFGVDPPSK